MLKQEKKYRNLRAYMLYLNSTKTICIGYKIIHRNIYLKIKNT